MPYTINLSNGNLLTIISDDTLDTSTSLTLLGRSFVGYGEIVAEDLVYLLENFANTTPPSNPLAGQLWYNTSSGVMNYYSGSSWQPVGGASTGINITQTTADNTGLVFYDPSAPANSRYYRIRVRDDGMYAGHLVIESLNGNNSINTVVFDTDSSGDVKLANLTVTGTAAFATATAATPSNNDNSTNIATTAFVKTNFRTMLKSSLSLYVSPTGSDSNNGLTSGTAFQTIQHAWDYLAKTYDGGGYQATVNLADGTYTSGLYTVYPLVGFQAINFVGNVGSPSNCFVNVTNSPCFSFSLPGVPAAYVSGVKMAATGTAGPSDLADQGYGIVARGIMLVNFSSVVFGACTVDHMWAGRGGCINISGNYTISGGASIHYACGNGGIIFASGITVTLTGTPAFSTAFGYPNLLGNLQVVGTTFSGSATGTKYIVGVLSSLDTNGAGTSYLPGTPSTGSTFGGGQYI